MKYNLFNIIFLISLTGCAWFGGSSTSNKSGKTKIPKTAAIQKPGGSGSNWRYLGTTDDGVLVDEVDINSISKNVNNGTTLSSYQDRKTVILPNKFAYPSNQPHFKYLISTWQMNCDSKEYLLNTVTLYNESGVKLIHYNYANDSDVKWLRLGDGSFANMQYNFICLNNNRNLGY
ncbi:MAG: hypothetical protein KBD37_07965 [Burkholderiales bacterium]|nr:hypothetical protein [Burkholderiales bacterium]